MIHVKPQNSCLARLPMFAPQPGKKGAEFEELDIELAGDVRKTKPPSAYDRKWQSEIERAHAPSGVPHECGDRQAP